MEITEVKHSNINPYIFPNVQGGRGGMVYWTENEIKKPKVLGHQPIY